MRVARAALAELDRTSQINFADANLSSSLCQQYGQTVEHATAELRDTHLKQEDVRTEELPRAWRRVLLAEKDEIISAFQHKILKQETFNRLLAEVNARLLRVESGEKPELPLRNEEGLPEA